ncbi:MAG: AzlD domain-containing protein [Firmicutes bacterium]|nr:AzlD domain-containing protein [Bacillota bacterium]
MTMSNYLPLIFAMAVVTYLPRMVPMVLLPELKLPSRLRVFFQYVPVAVLGALIFPDILYSTDSMSSAAIGAVSAVIIALVRPNVMWVIMGAIGAVIITKLFI